jgi:general secretion pathway protein G
MRAVHAANRHRGASFYETAVASVIVGVLAVVLLERVLYVQEYAEKSALELTIANLRAGLRARVAHLLMADRVSDIETLADENPMGWLEGRQENYLGELDIPPGEEPRGKWYFDRHRRELVYTANSRRHFSPSVYRDFTVRLRAMRVTPGGEGPSAKGQVWVALVVVNDYRWF